MAHPLLCWDIVQEGMNRREFLARDLKILQKIITDANWYEPPISIINSLIWENKTIVITDTTLRIIHATENMFAMNGYQQNEVIGKTPKMFQGASTEIAERQLIKKAIHNKSPFESIITNYRKNGSIYKCHIEGYPIFNKRGEHVNFAALENSV